jgi:hypothetical protein
MICAALLAAGWRHTPAENEVVGTRYRWRSSEVEFTFVEDRDGAIAHGHPLDLLREGKKQPRGAPFDAAKDVAGHAALADI